MYSMSRATRVYGTRFYASDFTPEDKKTGEATSEAPDRPKYERIDWEEMQAAAMSGKIPTPPVLRTGDECRFRLLRNIQAAAIAGDRQKLEDIIVGDYNTVMRMIRRYRMLCLLALAADASDRS